MSVPSSEFSNDAQFPAVQAANIAPPEPGVGCLMSEQDLIQELYAAIRSLMQLYGSQNAVARTLGVSSAMLTRASPAWLAAYTVHDRLARPHLGTLAKLARSSHDGVRRTALILISRRAYATSQRSKNAR